MTNGNLFENNLETNVSVFGESILNDGVAVVLFQVFKIRIDQSENFHWYIIRSLIRSSRF